MARNDKPQTEETRINSQFSRRQNISEPKVSHRKDRVHVSRVGKEEARPAVKRELEAGRCQASHAGGFDERHP